MQSRHWFAGLLPCLTQSSHVFVVGKAVEDAREPSRCHIQEGPQTLNIGRIEGSSRGIRFAQSQKRKKLSSRDCWTGCDRPRIVIVVLHAY